MSLTVEALAEELIRLNVRKLAKDRPEVLAESLLPFIERHIAAGQRGCMRAFAELYGAAGLMLAEIDTCGHEVDPAYRTTLYEAWEKSKPLLSATPQPPKPAGAVPLPEAIRCPPCATNSAWHWRIDGVPEGAAMVVNEEYARGWNAAREAAGRADAVPDVKALAKSILASETNNTDADGSTLPLLDVLSEAFGHKTVGPVREWMEDALFYALEALSQQPAAEGAGREPVGVVDGADRGGSISQTATLLRPLSSGTKLYTHPSPVADAEALEAEQHAGVAVVEAVPHTDASVDAIQAKMADLRFFVPVRVISEGMLAALAPQPKDGER